jgi:hypothetical protein
MKTSMRVLVLFALFALALCAQGMAQTPPAAPIPANTADFLATLSGAPGNVTSDLLPSPIFLSTLCATNADCPTGQLCCYPCGIEGCSRVCTQPLRGRCPLYP